MSDRSAATRWSMRVLLLVLGAAGVFILGYQASSILAVSYGEPRYNDDRTYYVQRYTSLSLKSFLPGMPGDGAANFDGFIRLHRADGEVIRQKFVFCLINGRTEWGEGYVMIVKAEPLVWELPRENSAR